MFKTELYEFNPFIRYITKRTNKHPDNTYSDYVYAYDHRLFLITGGEMDIYLDGEVYTLTANEAVIFSPCTPYMLKFNGYCEFFLLNFDFIYENNCKLTKAPQCKKEFEPALIFSNATCDIFPIFLHCSNDANQIFEKMLDYLFKKNVLYMEFVFAELKSFVINSIISSKYDKSPKVIKNVIAYIDKNYMNDITLSTLSEMFSYHPNYLNRLFKQNCEKTVHIYLNELRIAEAKRLLRTTDLSVGRICELCGFKSYSYFIKTFRIEAGLPPLKYRKINSTSI